MFMTMQTMKKYRQKAKDMIKISKEVSKTLHISISWHQRVCSSDYNWHLFYEEILSEHI